MFPYAEDTGKETGTGKTADERGLSPSGISGRMVKDMYNAFYEMQRTLFVRDIPPEQLY